MIHEGATCRSWRSTRPPYGRRSRGRTAALGEAGRLSTPDKPRVNQAPSSVALSYLDAISARPCLCPQDFIATIDARPRLDREMRFSFIIAPYRPSHQPARCAPWGFWWENPRPADRGTRKRRETLVLPTHRRTLHRPAATIITWSPSVRPPPWLAPRPSLPAPRPRPGMTPSARPRGSCARRPDRACFCSGRPHHAARYRRWGRPCLSPPSPALAAACGARTRGACMGSSPCAVRARCRTAPGGRALSAAPPDRALVLRVPRKPPHRAFPRCGSEMPEARIRVALLRPAPTLWAPPGGAGTAALRVRARSEETRAPSSGGSLTSAGRLFATGRSPCCAPPPPTRGRRAALPSG